VSFELWASASSCFSSVAASWLGESAGALLRKACACSRAAAGWASADWAPKRTPASPPRSGSRSAAARGLTEPVEGLHAQLQVRATEPRAGHRGRARLARGARASRRVAERRARGSRRRSAPRARRPAAGGSAGQCGAALCGASWSASTCPASCTSAPRLGRDRHRARAGRRRSAPGRARCCSPTTTRSERVATAGMPDEGRVGAEFDAVLNDLASGDGSLESATHSLRGGTDTVPDRAICRYFRGDRLTPKRSGTLQIKLGPARIRPLGARRRARGVS